MDNWIKEQRLRIKDSEDLILFDEAAGCLKNSFLRSSYIIAWICLIESLKRKLYLLSNLGDKHAENAIKKIETFEEQNNSVDKIIMEESKNCGIIENTGYSSLKYLWEQRCIFAHPYKIQPQIDEVKHILSITIQLSLGRELLFNKDYISEVVDNIVNKPFFLPVDKEKIKEYSKNVISRTPKNLFPFLFKTLLFKIGSIKDDDTKFNEQVKLRLLIIMTLSSAEKTLEDSAWALEDRAVKYPYECFFGFVSEDIWVKLPERIKEILILYIETEHNLYKLSIIKQITKSLIETDTLEDRFKKRFIDFLDKTNFDDAINYYGNNKLVYDRIISELETFDFSLQNNVIDFLRTENGIKAISGLDFKMQFYFGRILNAAAKNNHFKSQSLVHSIESFSIKYSEYVNGGIAFAHIINRQNLLNVEIKHVLHLVKILNDTSEEVQEFIYERIFSMLDENHADRFGKLGFSEELIKLHITDEVEIEIPVWKGMNKEKYELLIEKIRKYFS